MAPDRFLIPTKFAPPRISAQSTLRASLLARLRESRDSRLTLVCGNAGFGKTTLLAQWRQELLKQGERVAWLSLSTDEARIDEFGHYLVGALDQAGLPIDAGSGQRPDAVGLVATIVDAVCRLGKEVFLFVDDYHHVEDGAIHELVQGLLDHGPDELHLVLASRTHPPLAVSRMRMTGELVEISFSELPFDFPETRDFLVKQLGELPADDVRLIHDITDGWPVCVQMICIGLKRAPSSRAALSQMLHRRTDLQRYLAEDVVDHLPANVAAFIEKLSICRRFNAELASCVTGDPQASALLAQIEKDNLFVLPVEFDSPSPWYRFHPLFANFLLDRLNRRDPQGARDAHGRASRWFGEQGLLIEALRHAYHANDFEGAVRLVERGDLPIGSMSFIGILQRWMDQLEADVLLSQPKLLVLGCWALVATSRWRDAERWLDRLVERGHAGSPSFELQVGHIRASIALQRDDTEAALSLIRPDDFDALTDRFAREAHLAVLSFAWCAAGRYAEARGLHGRLGRLPRDEREDDMALVAESTLVLAHLLEGDNREAIRAGSGLIARAESGQGRRSVSAATCAAFLADAYYEADQLEEARAVLANRLDLLRWSSPEPMIRALITHRRLVAARAETDDALRGLLQDETRCRELALDRPLALVLAEQARLHLAAKDPVAAQKIQSELDRLAERHRSAQGFLGEIEAIVALAAARLALDRRDAKGLQAATATLRERAILLGRGRLRMLADLLEGTASTESGASDRLVAALERAQALGLVRSLLDEGEIVRQALTRWSAESPMHPASGHVANLLRRDQASHDAAGGAPAAESGEAFKPREIEILRLLAQSMSNKRIALTLNITLETVKWNLKNVFGKLGVPSRYDAVMAARKRGLLD